MTLTDPIETMRKLQEQVEALKAALKPFAMIKPSSWYAQDGSDAEGYQVLVTSSHADFTGADLARARSALENQQEATGAPKSDSATGVAGTSE